MPARLINANASAEFQFQKEWWWPLGGPAGPSSYYPTTPRLCAAGDRGDHRGAAESFTFILPYDSAEAEAAGKQESYLLEKSTFRPGGARFLGARPPKKLTISRFLSSAVFFHISAPSFSQSSHGTQVANYKRSRIPWSQTLADFGRLL